VIYVLTGDVGSGKTTLLRTIAAEMGAQKIPFDGFLSLRIMDSDETAGYDLYDIRDGRCEPFLRRTGSAGQQKVGPYYVLPGALALAEKIISRSRDEEILFVDEIGPLELERKGFWPFLKGILYDGRRRFIVVVRKSLLGDFLKIFAPVQVKVIDGRDAGNPAEIANDIANITVKI
jgi:nucleoside-triphosphatase